MRSPTRLLPGLLLCVFASAVATPAYADSLLGTSVAGTLSSGNPDYPSHISITNFTSPAIIGPGVEFKGVFTFLNYATFNIGADFSSSTLTVSILSKLSEPTHSLRALVCGTCRK